MKGMRNNAKGNGKNKWFRKNQRNQRNFQNKFGDIEVEGQTGTPQSKQNIDGKLTGQERTVNPLDMLAGSDAESDSGGELKKTLLTVIPLQVTSGLSKLISSYGSASDSDSEPEELAIKKVAKAVEENKQILESHSQIMAPSSANKKTDPSHGGHQTKHSLNKSQCNKHKKEQTKPVPGNKRPTLLEMLLAPDIRHERNVILQCVRYIVQNNFFDPVMNTNESVTSESSMKDEKDLNITENKSELNSGQHSDNKKTDAPGYFSRPIEPLDDEIWESNATCLESFCD